MAHRSLVALDLGSRWLVLANDRASHSWRPRQGAACPWRLRSLRNRNLLGSMVVSFFWYGPTSTSPGVVPLVTTRATLMPSLAACWDGTTARRLPSQTTA